MSSINQVISATQSFIARAEGSDVAVFRSEAGDIASVVESLGFARHWRKGTNTESAGPYSTNQFFNESTGESVFQSHGNDSEWTFCGSDNEPLTTASMSDIHL